MSALNLISADMKRLTKDKALKVILIIITVFAVFAAFMMKVMIPLLIEMIMDETGGAVVINEETFNMGLAFTLYLGNLAVGNLGFYAAIAGAIFLGSDYSFNTIRNKLISGNSRTKVYISSYITYVIIGMLLLVCSCIVTYIINLMFFGYVATNGFLIKATLLCIPLYLSIFAIMVFISMTIKSRTLGITINILIILFVPVILSYFTVVPDSGLAKVVEYVPYTIVSELLSTDNIATTISSLSGLLTIPDLSISLILRCILIPIPYIALFSGLGILIFKNADVK